MKIGQKVQFNENCPHYGEIGIYVGDEDTIIGKMSKFKLENCPHLTDFCFAKSDKYKEIK